MTVLAFPFLFDRQNIGYVTRTPQYYSSVQ